MIWLSWRQFRTKVLVVYVALALVLLVLLITGPAVADLYRTAGQSFVPQFTNDKFRRTVYFVGLAVVVTMPALLGAFWGAPLIARDLEDGTHRLVWTQSITRTRWLAVRLGLIGGAAAVAGLVSLAVTRWCAPFDRIVATGYDDGSIFSAPRLTPALFGFRGIVPAAYVVLAVAIGATVGLLLRRTVPAMAITLAAVVAIQIAVPWFVQPHLLSPRTTIVTITAENLRGLSVSPGDDVINDIKVAVDAPGAWVVRNQTVDSSGRVVHRIPVSSVDCAPQPGPAGPGADQSADPGADPGAPPDRPVLGGGPPPSCFAQLTAAGYRQQVSYQPADRFWPLQWIETGLMLAVALALSGFCFWRIRRDLS